MGILRSLEKYIPSARVLTLMFVVILALAAQIRYDQIGDRQGAGTKFWMANIGTSLPSTCTVGDIYFKTDATAGQNLYYCTAINTWTQQKDESGSTPTGTIAFFNLSSCPSSWTEYTSLRGRYAVGLPSGGTLEQLAGTALSDGENRAVGQHNHTFTPTPHSHNITDPGHTHSYTGMVQTGGFTYPGSGYAVYTTQSQTTGSSTTGISVDSASATGTIGNAGSVAGTNAPYVQLLACRKD